MSEGTAVPPPIINVSYADKNVLKIDSSGPMHITTFGWRTPKLKQKLNIFLSIAGWTISQSRGIWYLNNEIITRKRYLFEDDMVLNGDGEVSPCVEAPCSPHPESEAIKAYAARYVKLWSMGKVLPPCPGDPWNLYKRTLCVSPLDSELRLYIHAYMNQDYHFGSLLMAALLDVGGGDTEQLGVIDKQFVNAWLKYGTVKKCKLLSRTLVVLESLLRRYLFKVFMRNGDSHGGGRRTH